MADFINTIDVLGDDAVIDSIIMRTITEFKDNVITNVGAYAFHKCTSLVEVDLPNVSTIADNGFNNCSALVTLIVRSTAVCALKTNVFLSTPIANGTGYIYVPRALVDSYKAATNWSVYASQIRAIEDYPDICGG